MKGYVTFLESHLSFDIFDRITVKKIWNYSLLPSDLENFQNAVVFARDNYLIIKVNIDGSLAGKHRSFHVKIKTALTQVLPDSKAADE